MCGKRVEDETEWNGVERSGYRCVACDQRLSSEEEVWRRLRCARPFYTFWLALKF